MRKEKQLLLEEVKSQIENHGSFVIANYKELSANKFNELRRTIAKLGGNFEVVRKRVFAKASEQVGVKFDPKSLPGHIGIVFPGNDAIEMTKTVLKFSEDNDKAIGLLGGLVDGKVFDGKDIERLSKLPGRDQMRAELLGLFEAPMSQTLAVFEAVLTSVVYCLDNKAKESQEGSAQN